MTKVPLPSSLALAWSLSPSFFDQVSVGLARKGEDALHLMVTVSPAATSFVWGSVRTVKTGAGGEEMKGYGSGLRVQTTMVGFGK